MMMSQDNPVESLMTPRGKNPPRGKNAAKTPTSDPILGKPSIPGPSVPNMDAPSKAAPMRGAPASATGRGTSGRGPNASMPTMKMPTGGSKSMARMSDVPQHPGGPKPNTTISTTRGKTATAKSSFGSANKPAGRPNSKIGPAWQMRGKP